ncbi:MAG: AAA family ATPase [bacterium]|nr:AAA family ATPase [bacterium]
MTSFDVGAIRLGSDGDSPVGRLDHAVDYGQRGWRAIPITPGRKYPPLKEWQHLATSDLDTITKWWTGLYKDYGIGIATGSGSGFWVLDVDVGEGKQGFFSFREMVHQYGKLPPTITAHTGSGGLHLLFKWDPERPVTNGMATQLGPGLDIRGQGGQIVVAPSIHPNGEPYAWDEARSPWNQELAGAPDWLYKLIFGLEATSTADRASNEFLGSPGAAPEDLERGFRIELPPETGESPAEWIRRTKDWHNVLFDDGWQRHSIKDGETWWTRPGKDPKRGHSAVLHEPDGPLVIFSSEVDPRLLQAGRTVSGGSGVSLSVFDYLAAVNHNGDLSALSSAARAEMRDTIGPAPTVAPPARGEAPPEPDETELSFTELATWWDNPEPTRHADMLPRTDGQGLLYLDELNWIHGESGSCKTWVALHAAAELIKVGHHVAWIHYEDPTPALIVGRLKAFGLGRDEVLAQFHYHNPAGEPLNTSRLIEEARMLGIEHAFIDSVGEAMNAASIDENSDAEVGPWIVKNPRAFVNAGIGCTCIDHGTKAGTYKLYPKGSVRKRAAITGAGLLIEVLTSPTLTSDGQVKITMAKDRHGNCPQGSSVGVMEMKHDIVTGHLLVRVHTPGDVESHEREQYIDHVVRVVADSPGLAKRAILPLLPAASFKVKDDAIQLAIGQGRIRMDDQGRKGHFLYPIEPEAPTCG